jgi:hypothetical protein
VGALLGGGVSVAANIAHSYVPPKGAPSHWEPNMGAIAAAVFWPTALFVVLEILTRVPWPKEGRWVWLRWVGLPPVAAVAAVVSYRHMSGLLAWYGEDPLTVLIGPLAVDGLMVVATGALIATSANRAGDGTDTEPTAPAGTPLPDRVPATVTVLMPEWVGRDGLSSQVSHPEIERAPEADVPVGEAPPTPTLVEVGSPTSPTPEVSHSPNGSPRSNGRASRQPSPTPPKAPPTPTLPVGEPDAEGLTELQRTRLSQLADEFPGGPDDIPGVDKVITHMKERGIGGFTSRTPVGNLIKILKADRQKQGVPA